MPDYPFWATITVGLVLVILIGGGIIIWLALRPKRNGWDASEGCAWDAMTGRSGVSDQ